LEMTKSRPPIQRQRPCELRIDIESCPSSPSCSIDLPDGCSAGEPSTIDPNSLSPLVRPPFTNFQKSRQFCIATPCSTLPPQRVPTHQDGAAAAAAAGAPAAPPVPAAPDPDPEPAIREPDADASPPRGGDRSGLPPRRFSSCEKRESDAADAVGAQLEEDLECSFIPLSMLRHAPFSFSSSSATAVPTAQTLGSSSHLPDWRPGRVQLIANRSASQDRRDRGRREREECKKMALACYAVVCCVGAYALFSYVAFFMNG
ncbi:hypothetical protein PRIPAC_91739, partial [Pristionchus pacificus]|uniref:Uncharacterized protein n=1 Tax=Pristionchus pacificus TaxID=54126 RepID=A0A2A6CHM4_PRIPA